MFWLPHRHYKTIFQVSDGTAHEMVVINVPKTPDNVKQKVQKKDKKVKKDKNDKNQKKNDQKKKDHKKTKENKDDRRKYRDVRDMQWKKRWTDMRWICWSVSYVNSVQNAIKKRFKINR